MRRRIVLALALVLGASPIGAHAAPSPAARRAAAVARWEARRARLARQLPLDPAVAAALAPGGDDARLLRAGDLDGDGASDLVDLRTHTTYDTTTDTVSTTSRLEAHRGRDGKALWSVSLGTSSYVFPLVTKVGANGKNGVVVVQYDDTWTDAFVAGASAAKTVVTAIDGTGTQAWSRTLAGEYSGSIGGGTDAAAYVVGVFDAISGGGADVLVEVPAGGDAYDPVGLANGSAAGAQLVVIDGATGVPRPYGAPVPGTGWGVEAETMPDLNGDHLDDAVVATAVANTSRLIAFNSATGAPLWTAALPDAIESFPYAVGDVTGDGVADVAVSHFPIGAMPVGDTYLGSRVSLVDGKTGAVRWTKPGDSVVALGNIDHAAGAEVAVTSYIDDSKTIGLAATAYDASGKASWSVRRSAAAPPCCSADVEVDLAPIGDVQTDGITDIGYIVAVTPAKGAAHYDAGTFDGRTGRVILDPVVDLFAALVPFDGHGNDAYTRKTDRGALTVTAWRGDSPRVLWRTSVAAAGAPVRSLGYDLDHDGCGELVVSTSTGSAVTSYAFAGPAGQPLWSLTRTGDAAAVVGHPSATKRSHPGKAAC